MVACAKVIVFFGCFVVFFLAAQKHYKNRVFLMILRCWILVFWVKKSRVNNLATVGSITWPHFLQTFWKIWPSYWPYSFHGFFVKTCFFQKSHSPCRKKTIFEKQKRKTKDNKKVAKLLTYGGQVIDPTAYIYMYIYIFFFVALAHFAAHILLKKCHFAQFYSKQCPFRSVLDLVQTDAFFVWIFSIATKLVCQKSA